MSYRQGADLVSAVEFPGHVSDLCEENLLRNGLYHKVQLIPKAIKNVTATGDSTSDMKSKAQILVMEVFDCGLIGEGALHILKHVHENLLVSNAICIPCGASLYAQPVQLDAVRGVHGFNVDALGALRRSSEYESIDLSTKSQEDLRALAEPALAFSFDFYEIRSCLEAQSTDLVFSAKTDGCFNAVLFWFDLYLDEEQTLTSNPYISKPSTKWKPAVQWLPECVVKKGQSITLRASHDTRSFTFKVAVSPFLCALKPASQVLEDLESGIELSTAPAPDWWQNKLNNAQSLHSHLVPQIRASTLNKKCDSAKMRRCKRSRTTRRNSGG